MPQSPFINFFTFGLCSNEELILWLFRNLQAAVCAYFDYESPRDKLPMMALVCDITVGDGESVPPNTKFIKTWRVQNAGKLLVIAG